MKYLHKGKKGIVLVIVLWVLFFLSTTALTLSFNNRINIKLRSLGNEKLRMLYLAEEGINRALVKLAEDDPEFDASLEEWNKNFSLQSDEGLLSYNIVDEDRFLNINTESADMLNKMETFLPALTEEICGQIIKGRPFNTVNELLDVTSLENKYFYSDAESGNPGICDFITVFSDGKFNINTMPEQIIRIIPGIDENTVSAVVEHRKNSPFKKNDTLSEELSLLGLTAAQVSGLVKVSKVNSSVFRISINAVSRNKHVSKKMVRIFERDKGVFKVLMAKEN